jgi:hypothetical protein
MSFARDKFGVIALAACCAAVAAAPALGQGLAIRRDDCARLVEHVPAPDVAYRPGVDVRGRPVAPADLPGTVRIDVPETITFDAAADLRRFGLPAGSRLYAPHADIGQITIERDGRAYFNGQPLQASDNDALARYCRQRLQSPR